MFVARSCIFVTAPLARRHRPARARRNAMDPNFVNMMARDTLPVLRQDQASQSGGSRVSCRHRKAMRAGRTRCARRSPCGCSSCSSSCPRSSSATPASPGPGSRSIARPSSVSMALRDGHVPRLAGDDRPAFIGRLPLRGAGGARLRRGQHDLRPDLPGLDRRPCRRRPGERCPPISAAPTRSMLNYILVFGVNMILFHVNYARRAGIQQERQLAEANLAAQQAQLAALALPAQSAFPVQCAELDLRADRHQPQQGCRGDDRQAVELPAHLAERRPGRAHPARRGACADRGISRHRERALRRAARASASIARTRPARRWCRASWSSLWSRMR